jgi:hypothetical protein
VDFEMHLEWKVSVKDPARSTTQSKEFVTVLVHVLALSPWPVPLSSLPVRSSVRKTEDIKVTWPNTLFNCWWELLFTQTDGIAGPAVTQ